MPDAPDSVDRSLLMSQSEASLRQGSTVAAAAGFLFLTLAAIFLFYFLPILPLTVLWAVPIVFPIVFGALILLAAQQAEAAGRASHLAQPADLTASPAVPGGTAPWRLNGALRLLAAAPFAIFAGLYLVVLYYCWRAIYPFSHLMGVGFGLFYLALTLVEIAALVYVLRYLPRQAAQGAAPVPARSLQTFGRWILPFPRSPFDGRIFWVGFLAPLLLGGLNGSRWAIVNILFRDRQDWNTMPDVPLLAVVALGLLLYLIFEVLLHQAVMIWGARQAGAHSVPYPEAQIVLRWLLALVLASAIDWRGLGTLLLITTVYHAVNILLVQRGTAAGAGRLPVLKLAVDSLGLPLRFAAGVMVWGNPSWDYSAFAFMGVLVYFLALGITADRWHTGALACQEQDPSYKNYFLEHGAYWRKVGLWSALLSGILLVVMQTLSESCAIRPGSTFASFYAACPFRTTTLIYTRLDKFNSLFIAFDMVLLVLIIMMLLVWGLQGPLERLMARARPFSPLLQPAYLLVGLAVVFAALVNLHSLAWAAFGVCVGVLGLIVGRRQT